MNKEIKQISMAALFLALACVLNMIQIPTPFAAWLSIDFSLVPIIISRRYISAKYVFMLTFIFPWFSLLSIFGSSGGLTGVAFLALQVWPLVALEFWWNKDGNSVFGTCAIVLVMILYSTLLNNFIINPVYFGFVDYYSDLWNNLKLWFPIALSFNILKLILVYIVVTLLRPLLAKETYNK